MAKDGDRLKDFPQKTQLTHFRLAVKKHKKSYGQKGKILNIFFLETQQHMLCGTTVHSFGAVINELFKV